MVGIIEEFLLEGEFAALEGHLGSTATVGERLVHGTPHINHQQNGLL